MHVFVSINYLFSFLDIRSNEETHRNEHLLSHKTDNFRFLKIMIVETIYNIYIFLYFLIFSMNIDIFSGVGIYI